METVLLVSEDPAIEIEPYASAFADIPYAVVKMGVDEALKALEQDAGIVALLIDSPSKTAGIRDLTGFVDRNNSYVCSRPILILTSSATAQDDLAYLGGAVIDCIRKPIHPLILRNRLRVAMRMMNSASFSDFSRMLKALPSVIYLKDTKGRYAFSSQAMHHLNVSDPELLRGKTDLEIRRDKGNAEIAMRADQELLRSGKGTSYIIKEEEDGALEYLEIIKEPLYFEDGRTRGIIGLVNNVTEQEQLRLELKRLTVTDELTGLYNRSYFDEYISNQLGKAVYPVSIITADCDQLKLINDSYGHLAGDEYIRMAAAVMRACLPESSVLCRVGGDEFAAIIPGTDEEQAKELIAVMKQNMGSYQLRDRVLSVSFGSGTLQSESESVKACITRSDDDMYRDKAVRKKERTIG